MATRHDMISEIKANLERCGYSDQLLQANYSYEDDAGKHNVPLVAFARPVYDSRTSCISVINNDSLYDVHDAQVYQFRGLGTPVIFVCCQNTVQWWTIGTRGAELRETHSESALRGFFEAHKAEFAPDRIRRAKNLGNVIKGEQLYFVDAGLMPLIEQEMGKRLASLMERVLNLLHSGFTEKQLEDAKNQRWIFRAAFWLLCAKILRDKGVRNFVHLDLTDVDAVLETVTIHYGAQEPMQAGTAGQRQALEEAAGEINRFAGLSNLTTEAFGCMYEDVLVDKDLRAALGIHATPPYLVDYMVWQLWPWIEQIPEDKRVVLEPACGHAPFLTGAMRLLRELFQGDAKAFHRYAKRNLVGIEKDPFAREFARLSLTMADIPNPNGWNIIEGDIYQGDLLTKKAEAAMVLLCNPPFEDFKPAEKRAHRAAGQTLRFDNKAAEMLWRTLPHMPAGALFGVVLPRGFLHREKLAELRKMIVNDFELLRICLLPARVFRRADHKSIVVLGRKTPQRARTIEYAIVPEDRLEQFRSTYRADREIMPLESIEARSNYDLRVTPLQDIWEYCGDLPTFDSVAMVGRGIEFRSVKDATSRTRFVGAKQGFARFEKTGEIRSGKRKRVMLKTTELPDLYWMDLSERGIANPRYGMPTGQPRVLLNYGRSSRDEPWRLKPLIDEKGRATSNCCMVIEPKSHGWDCTVLWAVLNSPLSNAFVFCHSMERHNLEGTIRKIPVPNHDEEAFDRIRQLVNTYFVLDRDDDQMFRVGPDKGELRRHLLSIDAEVMRLYGLPPKMERRVLDLFQGSQRKGVDFRCDGYYPDGFESAIPLHEYLSEEYQRSTIAFADEWVRKNRSPEMNRVLRGAVEAFEEGEDA
ncbi:MAG: N-6 DNA methylase [Phycisphaerae bacterium]|nr:N-6 DNA methylase [Phycisphaerae bacterium]